MSAKELERTGRSVAVLTQNREIKVKKRDFREERGTLAWFHCFFLDFLGFFLRGLHLRGVYDIAFFEVGRGKFGLFFIKLERKRLKK